MKKIILLLISMILLTSCGAKRDVESESIAAEERYVAEKLLSEDVNFCMHASWIQGINIYAMGTSRSNHESQLLKYDMEGQLLSKTVLDMGKNCLGNCSQAYVDDKGQFHVLCYYLNEQETEIAGYRFCVYDSNGKLVEETDYTEAVRPFLKALRFPAGLIILPDGRMLFAVQDEKMVSTMMLLSDSGEVIFQKDLGKTEVRSLLLRADGKVYSIEKKIKHEAPYTIGEIDLSTGDRKELALELPKASTIKFVEGAGMDLFFCVTDNGIWEISEKGPKMLLALEDVSLGGAYDVSEACELSDGTWRMLAIVKREAGEYNYFDYNVLRLAKSKEETGQKTELTLAVLSEYAGFYKNDILEFNKTQNDVKVVLREYESRDSLITDLTAGNIPDLLDLAEGKVYEMMERKGFLEDVGKYLATDKAISQTDFLEKTLKFYEKDGKIYSIPYGMVVSAMMGSKSYLEDRGGWNLEEYKDFILSLPDQAMATRGISKQEMLRILCVQYMDHFVDREKGKCDFQTKEFSDLLEFANYYPDQGANVNEIPELFEDIQMGDIILIPITLQEVRDYELYRALFPDEAQIIGYPMEGKEGISLIPVGKTLSMISMGEHKDSAWNFMKYVMTSKINGFELFYSYRPFYDELIAETKEEAESKEAAWQIAVGGVSLAVPHASLKEIEMLENMIQNGNVTGSGDEAVLKIISEEAEAYFSGNKTIEQIAESIQNRVELYLAE